MRDCSRSSSLRNCSRERTKGYGQADWDAVQTEQTKILKGIAELADRRPDDPEVQAAVKRCTAYDRFYTCPLEIYRGLGDLALQDERFTATYEKLRPGLVAFFQKAVQAYCDQGEV